MGRCVADPETRYTQSNMAISRFRLAVNRRGKQAEGQPSADFFDIVTFQKTAEFVGKYFTKGMQVLVEGRLRNDQWTDKEGQKRIRTEVNADWVYFAEGRRSDSDERPQPARQEAAHQDAMSAGDGFYTMNEDDEDLPF